MIAGKGKARFTSQYPVSDNGANLSAPRAPVLSPMPYQTVIPGHSAGRWRRECVTAPTDRGSSKNMHGCMTAHD